MSEKLLKFLLAELKIVRVVCRHQMDDGKACGGIIEVPIQSLYKIEACPICKRYIGTGAVREAFHQLANGVAELQKPESVATLEFVLPDKSE